MYLSHLLNCLLDSGKPMNVGLVDEIGKSATEIDMSWLVSHRNYVIEQIYYPISEILVYIVHFSYHLNEKKGVKNVFA